MIFNQFVPKEVGFVNALLTKKNLREIIGDIISITNIPKTAKFLDDIKDGKYDRYMDLSVGIANALNPAMRKALGLDQPLWKQYVTYLGNLAQGDLGRSFRTNESVSREIAARYPATMQLAFDAGANPVLLLFKAGGVQINGVQNSRARFRMLLDGVQVSQQRLVV